VAGNACICAHSLPRSNLRIQLRNQLVRLILERLFLMSMIDGVSKPNRSHFIIINPLDPIVDYLVIAFLSQLL